MPKSEAFARIHRDVMTIAAAIPAGRVATFADIGTFLDVVPRQVAFLLARRNDPERETAPWHRVVADDGALGRPKYDAWGRAATPVSRPSREPQAHRSLGRRHAAAERSLLPTGALGGAGYAHAFYWGTLSKSTSRTDLSQAPASRWIAQPEW